MYLRLPAGAVDHGEGNDAPPAILWIAIVQNADSSSLFDDLDAALQSGSSEKRAAMLRQVTNLFLGGPRDDGLLIPCKAADFKWETGSAILATKLPPGSAPKTGHEKLKIDFDKLSKPNAQRLLRFWQVREVSVRSA
jgi:hypothetical protein